MSWFYYKTRQFFYYILSQHFITKHGSLFITFWVSFITNLGRYYILSRFYYKSRQLLQNQLFITILRLDRFRSVYKYITSSEKIHDLRLFPLYAPCEKHRPWTLGSCRPVGNALRRGFFLSCGFNRFSPQQRITKFCHRGKIWK